MSLHLSLGGMLSNSSIITDKLKMQLASLANLPRFFYDLKAWGRGGTK